MAGSLRIIVLGAWNLTGKLFESLPLGLRNEKRGEDTAQHEEGENLHNVIEPRVRVGFGRLEKSQCLPAERLKAKTYVALCAERSEDCLCNDSTDLARGGGDTVGRRTVTGWETFSRNDEGGGVRSKVEEQLGKDV